MPETPQTFYLTTPIYYVNARPHIGHAYTTIVADVLARRARAQGIDTYFLTGTDEHGQKIERSAAAAGIPPQQFADEVSATFSTLWQRMGITHDDFIRTTSARHKRGVQKLFKTLQANGKIELRSYTGSYCVSDEAFVDLPAGAPCPDCGRPLETVTEQNYFFKLSEYQLPLINLIESNQLAIQPESRRNEVLSFLRGPVGTFQPPAPPAPPAPTAPTAPTENLVILSEAKDPCISPSSELPQIAYSALGTPYIPGALKDLSISRTSFKWGIPVPGDEQHVIYVWFDALANYMTALGYGAGENGEDGPLFQKFWPADLHIVGKEIIRFHCVYWPAFLLALRPEDVSVDEWIPKWIPKQVVAHGWLLFEESKMSKSRGNIVRTETILDAFGPLCPQRPIDPSFLSSRLSSRSEAERSAVAPSPAPTPPQAPVILSEDARSNAPLTTEPVILSEGSRGLLREPQSKDPEESALATSAGTFPTGNSEAAEAEQASLKHHQDLFAADILRYFLLREIPFGQDGSFSFDALITRYNADLANGYGNLVSRTLTMIQKYFGGSISPQLDEVVYNNYTARENASIHASLAFGPPEIERIDAAFQAFDFTGALARIQGLIKWTDELLSLKSPWKEPEPPETALFRRTQVLYTAAESIRIITLLLNPILPYATAKVWAQLGLDPAQLTSNIKHLASWGGLQPGTKLGPLSPIFPRADVSPDKGLARIMTDMENPQPIACVTGPNDPPSARLSAITEQHDATHPATGDLPVTSLASEAPSTAPGAGPRTANLTEPNPGAHVAASASITTERPGTPPHTEAHASGIFAAQPSDASPQITIDDFAKIELRVAQILVCERIPKADKLLRLEVDLGYEKRQILSGIAEWYTPEELLGRRIVVITNLAPRKMRGLESHGMLLAASTEGGKPHLATFTGADSLPLGSRLK